VTILADAAEAAEEIDIARAERARERAVEALRRAREQGERDVELAGLQAALQRSLLRLRVVQRRRHPGPPRPGG
jgi:F-type H+-transporting ATPase subunit epsilon